MRGRVFLVGAGPGDPELLTVKAARILREADVVLHDDLVSSAVLGNIPQTAVVRNVGKRCGHKQIRQEEIQFLMIGFASQGLRVVRLKSGDPMIFGRAGEEIEALRKAGVECEIVPGVTAALAAAASAQIPLTHRRLASSVVFLTGSHAEGSPKPDLRAIASSGATLVFYMPGHDYREISRMLTSAGWGGDTPCALVSRASQREQRVVVSSVDQLPAVQRVAAPAVVVVGPVIQLGDPRFLQQEVMEIAVAVGRDAGLGPNERVPISWGGAAR